MEDQPSKRLGYLHRMMMMVVMNYDEGEEMKDHIEPLASDVLASLERFLKEKKDELSPQDLRNAGRVLKSLRRLPSLSPLCSKHLQSSLSNKSRFQETTPNHLSHKHRNHKYTT